jgi:hypothetical protein
LAKTVARHGRFRELDQAIDAVVTHKKLAALLWEIARGATRTVLHPETGIPVRIRDAPDAATARYLADRKGGRPTERVQLTGDPSAPVHHEHRFTYVKRSNSDDKNP